MINIDVEFVDLDSPVTAKYRIPVPSVTFDGTKCGGFRIWVLRLLTASLARGFAYVVLSPFSGRHARFAAENVVELGARRESTFGRDCLVAIFGMLEHQPLCLFEAQIGKPDAERAVVVLTEVKR